MARTMDDLKKKYGIGEKQKNDVEKKKIKNAKMNDILGKYNSTTTTQSQSSVQLDGAVSSYASNAKAFYDSLLKDYNNITPELFDFDGNYGRTDWGDYTATWDGIKAEQDKIRKHYEDNRSTYGNQNVDSILKNLDDYNAAVDDIIAAIKENREILSQYESKEEYDAAVKYSEEWYNKWGHYAESDDFEEFSAKGASAENPTWNNALWSMRETFEPIMGWRPFAREDKIKNIVTYSRDNAGSIAIGDQGAYDVSGDIIYTAMKDEEVDLYNYFIGKELYDEAQEYLNDLNPILGERIASDADPKNIKNPVLRAASSTTLAFVGGLEQSESGIKQFFSKEERPKTGYEYMNEGLIRNTNGVGKYALSAVSNIGNMAPSILLSSVATAVGVPAPIASGLGSAYMGMSAAGSAYKSALEKGYDKKSARTYSTLVGASEAVLQYFLGGISKLGGLNQFFAGKIAAIDKIALRIAARYGLDLVGEIAEEELQNYLEPLFRKWVFSEEYDAPKFEELFETAVVTWISTSVMGAGEIVGEEYSIAKKGKDVIQDGSVSGLKNFSDSFGGFTADEQRMVDRLRDNISDYEASGDGLFGKGLARIKNFANASRVGRLANTISDAVSRQNTADIQTALEAAGLKGGKLRTATDILSAIANGEEISDSDLKFLGKNEGAMSVFTDVILDKNSSVNKRNAQLAAQIEGVSEQTTEQPTQGASEDRFGTEGRFGVSENGQATIRGTDKTIDFSKVEVTQVGEGQITFKLEDGTEVYAGDIDFADDNQSYMVSAISDIENITPGAATAMIRDIVDTTKPLGEQMNGIDEAYTYGYHGYSEADLKAGIFTSGITKKQMMSAYKLGQSARNSNTDAADAPKVSMRTALQAKMTAAEKAAKQRSKFDSDDIGVYFMDGKNITKVGESGEYKGAGQNVDRRIAAVNYAKLLSKLGIGNNYYFFESYKNKNGDRVYKDADGNEVSAPNGFYIEDTGDIYIDLNAGDNGQGIALFVLGHELTHFIKEWSNKKFNVLADFLVAEYGKTDMTMHERVLAKQAELEGIRKNQDNYKPVKYDEAFEEVVADAMSAMLADGNLHEKLAKLRTKDKVLGDKIIEFFNRMIAKFQALYKDLDPEQRDARDVRAMKDSFDRIQQAFAEALVEASDNFRATKEIAAETAAKPTVASKNAKVESKAKTEEQVETEVETEEVAETEAENEATSQVDELDSRIEELRDKAYELYLEGDMEAYEKVEEKINALEAEIDALEEKIEAEEETSVEFDEDNNFDDLDMEYDDGIEDNLRQRRDERIKELERQRAELRDKEIDAIADGDKATREKLRNKIEAIDKRIKQVKSGSVVSNVKFSERMGKVIKPKAEAISNSEIITDGAVVTDGQGTKYSIKDIKKKGGSKAKKTAKAVDTLSNQTLAAQPADGVKNSNRNPKWKPKLDNTEWGIVNYIVEHNKGTSITSTCNMFFEKSKGRTLFGIYSTEDSTLLYAAREQTAEKEHIFVDFLREEYKNGNVTDTSAEGLRAWAKAVWMQRTASDYHGAGNVAPGRSAGDVGLHGGSFRLYASTALRNVLENIFRKETAGRVGVKNSERTVDAVSNRTLLANAFEGLSQNSDEYAIIQRYRNRIRLLEEQEEKLDKINAEIREIRFTSGKYDAKKLAELEAKKKEISEAITRHDKKLLEMEVSAPFRKVIEQERKKEAQKTKAHIAVIQQNKQLRAEQAELRHKVRKVIRDLDKILKRGNKERNVKEDMKGFVSKALELADYLFTDHISNDDLIMRGIDADLMRGDEAELVRETEEIIRQIQDNYGTITEEEYKRLTAKKKRNMEALRELLTKQRNRRLNTPVYNLFDDLVTEYAKLKDSTQAAVKASYNPNVEHFLRSYMGVGEDGTDADRKSLLQNMRVADMTTEELKHLYYAYTMVLKSVRDANQLFVDGQKETVTQVAERISADFAQRKVPKKDIAIIAKKIANKIGWDYEKLYYALDRIGSEAFTELVLNVANSENIVMQDVIEVVAFRDEMVEKYGFNDWNYSKKIDRDFVDNTGKKFRLTLGELMSLYAYSRREGAWDHIEYGGFAFGEKELKDPKPADTYKLTKEQCEAITDLLTKEQKGYVEAMQKFLSKVMGAKGNEVSMKLYGIKLFTEENYFPLHIYGAFKAQADEANAKAAAGFGAMKNAGFTHALKPNAKAPFVLDAFNEVWADHVNEMSRYHGAVPALEDLRRVMNTSTYTDSAGDSISIKQLMENAFGKEAVDYFEALYKEANSGAIRDKLQSKSHKLLSLFRKNSVAYSLSVLIQQPASMVRAYAMIDRKYFGFKGIGALSSGIAKAVSNKWTNAHTNAYNEMLKYAPGVTMAKEIGGFDTHTGSSIRGYLLDTKKSFGQKVKTDKHGKVIGGIKAAYEFVDDNAIANLPNVADKIAWIEIWNACKRETIANHKDLVPTSDEFLQIVGGRFTEVIRATQVYDSMFSKSPMLKSKNLAVQYLVSFMNEPNTVANMVEKAVRDVSRGDWKSGARTAVVVIHSIIFTNLLKSIIYVMRDDEEDETYIEKYIEALTKGMVSDFLPFNYIPLVRDAWSKLQGFDVERPDVAIIADAIESFLAIYEKITKDTENMTEKQLEELDKKVIEARWELAESVAAFFGIPVKNIRREINGFMDHARIASENAGMTTLPSAWDKVRDGVIDSIPFMSSKPKTDKLYEAMIAGDKAYVERIKGSYKTESAYQSAVRKALRENDSRIHEAAMARYEGRTEDYKRIFREIQAEGIFNFDDIMSAVNSEENKIRNKVEPEKQTSSYSAHDYVEAIMLGDINSATDIKNDIIDTMVANDKTREEADKEFTSSISTGIRDAYSSGLLDEAEAERMLQDYADKDEEKAASMVSYWSFCEDHPEYKDILSESNVADYHEFAEPADISVEVFAKYVENTKDLATIHDEWGDVAVSKREQVLEVIDSFPISEKQKDALYLAAGYSESKIWDVPW